MATLAELMVKVGVSTEEFAKGITKMSKDAKAFGKDMEALGSKIATGLKVGAAAGAAGLAALVTSGVKANANMEAYRNTLNTVMGDSQKAAKTLDWVKQYAAKTPFELPGLVESTVKLSAMGLEAEKFIPVAADMAAVFQSSGKTVQDASEAINDAMMGEFERLKEFGIKLGATDFAAGGKYAGKTYAEAIMEEVKNHNYTGAAEGLSSTFAGRLSTLKDTIGNFIQNATVPAFESLSESLGKLMTYIDQLQSSGKLDQWAAKTTAALTTMGNILIAVGKAGYDAAKFIIDNWGLIEPIIVSLGAAFIAYKTYVIATQVPLKMAAAAQWALNAAMTANPIGLVVAAIAALVAAGVLLYKNWDTVKEKLSGVWNSIKGVAESVWNGLKAFFEAWGKTILLLAVGPAGWAIILAQKLGINWTNIKTTATTAWNGIKSFFSNTWNSIKSTSDSIWNGIKSAIISPIESAKQTLLNIINTIKNAFANMHITIPKPKIPHITVATKYKTVGSVKVPYPDFDIDFYAQGTNYARGGWAVVGEKGPELLNVPRGSKVVPNNKIEEIGGVTIKVEQMIVRNDQDIELIARRLYELQQRAARGKGLVMA